MIKALLLVLAVVVRLWVSWQLSESAEEKATKAKAAAEAKAIEAAIREYLEKPTGELTKVDLEKVPELELNGNQLTEIPKGLENLTKLEKLILSHNYQLTDVTGLEKLPQLEFLSLHYNRLIEIPKGLKNLTQLEQLDLSNNPDLTEDQINELQKALPKCKIE